MVVQSFFLDVFFLLVFIMCFVIFFFYENAKMHVHMCIINCMHRSTICWYYGFNMLSSGFPYDLKTCMLAHFVVSCSGTEGKRMLSPSVIVIGGGFAGIAAARALHDASFQVRRICAYLSLSSFVVFDISFFFGSIPHAICFPIS